METTNRQDDATLENKGNQKVLLRVLDRNSVVNSNELPFALETVSLEPLNVVSGEDENFRDESGTHQLTQENSRNDPLGEQNLGTEVGLLEVAEGSIEEQNAREQNIPHRTILRDLMQNSTGRMEVRLIFFSHSYVAS